MVANTPTQALATRLAVVDALLFRRLSPSTLG